MLATIASLWIVLLGLQGTAPIEHDAEFSSAKARAEQLCAEGSWALAHEAYAAIDPRKVPPEEKTWVEFRLADTLWRGQRFDSATRRAATAEATRRLQDLIDELEGRDPHPRVWAEAQESLADLGSPSSGRSLPGESREQRLSKVLEWWATAPATDEARHRYLAVVWKLGATGERPWAGPRGGLTRVSAREVVSLARTPEELCKANLLLARSMVRDGGPASLWTEIEGAFERAHGAERNPCTGDALFEHAEWIERYGRQQVDDSGRLTRVGDLVRALELYRRLESQFKPNETRNSYQARSKVSELTHKGAWIKVSGQFLPGSPAKAELSWRSVDRIDLALFHADLLAELALEGAQAQGSWIDRLDPAKLRPLRRWSKATRDSGDLVRTEEDLPLDLPAGPGCYLLVAASPVNETRALVVVSDLVLAARTARGRTMVWVTSAPDGTPVGGAQVSIWEPIRERTGTLWRQRPGATTDAQGLAWIDRGSDSGLLLVAVGDRQTWAGLGAPLPSNAPGWLAYSWTDRPAYRPGETVHLSVTVRRQGSGEPAPGHGLTLTYAVQGPTGTRIAEGGLVLDEYGVGDASFVLPVDGPLGACSLRLHAGDKGSLIAPEGPLFRVEEYRLPEFKVEVAARAIGSPEAAIRSGDPVEIAVAATYFHGAPVVGAEVEVLLYRLRSWTPYGQTPWRNQPWVWQPNSFDTTSTPSIDLRERLTTDAQGRARTVLDTAWIGDERCGVTALVTDVSRRESSGATQFAVRRQPVQLRATTDTAIVPPGTRVRLTLRAVGPNDEPVSWRGEARVVREVWTEAWVDPQGREVRGLELRRLKASYGHPGAIGEGWRQRDQTTVTFEEVGRLPVTVPPSGTTELEFEPPRPGKYTVRFVEPGAQVRPWLGDGSLATLTLWVADAQTRDLEHYSQELAVTLGRNPARVGDHVTGLIVSPLPGRWVLLTIDAGEREKVQVLRVEGTVATFDLPVTADHSPNMFVQAHSLLPRRLAFGQAELVVPPEDHFLDVTIEPERTAYRPGDEVGLCLHARDQVGNGVAGQFAVSVFDAAVLSIQPELAGDIRAFFFGRLRPDPHGLTAFNGSGVPIRLEEVDGKLVDEVSAQRERDAARRRAEEKRRAGPATAPGEPPPVPGTGGIEGASFAETISVATDPIPRSSQVRPRSDFSATALWQPRVQTDASGEARITFTLPESTTEWRAVARGVTSGAQAGWAAGSFSAAKPVQARVQVPRFLVAGDVATAAVVTDNATPDALAITPALSAQGAEINGNPSPLLVDPGRSARADFTMRAEQPGVARLVGSATAEGDLDAVERLVPVLPHGIEKVVSRSGELAGATATVRFELPARDAQTATATLQVATSPAAVLLDALPTLLDAPTGCTEATVSRFLPAVIVARTLERLGIPRARLEERLLQGRPPGLVDANGGPTVGIADLARLLAEGRRRLADLQRDDGGWGWCEGHESDPLMTAHVVWSLSLLDELDGADEDLARDGADYLEKTLGPALGPDIHAFGLLALASFHRTDQDELADLGDEFDALFEQRASLRPAGLAHLAMVGQLLRRGEAVAVLIRNLANGAISRTVGGSSVVDPELGSGDTPLAVAHWESPGATGATFDGPVEGTAFVVLALRALDPTNPLLPAAERWLALNRRGVAWRSSRETALAILALSGAVATATPPKGCSFEAQVNGRPIASFDPVRCEPVDMPIRRAVDPALFRTGGNELRIRRSKAGSPLWFAFETRFFTHEDPIAPAASGVVLRRQYLRLEPRPTLLRGPVYEKTELTGDSVVRSGDRVEVVLTIEAPTDLAYLVIEDRRPAGWEAVDLRSGQDVVAHQLALDAATRRFGPPAGELPSQGSQPGQGPPAAGAGVERKAFRELRDEAVRLYLDHLPEGIWEIRYLLRAETPGRFHGLPARVHAAYAPELAANSGEHHAKVED
jgi:alpha-2-macroglobulin